MSYRQSWSYDGQRENNPLGRITPMPRFCLAGAPGADLIVSNGVYNVQSVERSFL
jgi:hypothetical protein